MPKPCWDKPPIESLEISVFGPGRGECIVVHVPGGYWFAIDSLRVKTKAGLQPIAGDYLRTFGGELSALFLTHWHSDHTAGAADLIRQFAHSLQLVGLPGGFGERELASFLSDLLPDDLRFRKVRDLVDVISALREPPLSNIRRVLLGDGMNLAPHAASWHLEALSPSFEDVRTHMATLGRLLSDSIGERPLSFDVNGACAVLRFEIDGRVGMFCSDLHLGDSELHGWHCIVRSHGDRLDSHFVKVGHHGSRTAHHDEAWKLLTSTEPTHATVTPFPARGGALPRPNQLRRLRGLATTLHVTARASRSQPKRVGNVKLEQTPFSDFSAVKARDRHAIGHVRFRLHPGESDFQITPFPPAMAIQE